jgi:cytidyltransferase-like protein
MSKVLTIGTFDPLHYGHIDLLGRCSGMGSLTVGVNSDEFVKTFKAAPIMNQGERSLAIMGLGYPTVLNHSAGKELIEHVRPDILAVGSDWARKDYLKQIGVTQDWLDSMNIILAYIPRRLDISSTEIKRRIREQ